MLTKKRFSCDYCPKNNLTKVGKKLHERHFHLRELGRKVKTEGDLTKYISVPSRYISVPWQAEYEKLRQSLNEVLEVVPTTDMINHPPHYTFGKYEVFDVLMDWFASDPVLWQVVKYVARANHKGSKLTDLSKARFYLTKAIEQCEKELEVPNNVL
jgi:hypothetical protein